MKERSLSLEIEINVCPIVSSLSAGGGGAACFTDQCALWIKGHNCAFVVIALEMAKTRKCLDFDIPAKKRTPKNGEVE